jgi:hypothetical protein
MVKPGHVSCDFDVLDIGDNDLENFKNIFGKVAKNLKLNYEIQTLGKMKGGASAPVLANLSSTFPYNYFETTLDSFLNKKSKLNEERKGIYASLFGDSAKPSVDINVENKAQGVIVDAKEQNNTNEAVAAEHKEGMLERVVEMKDTILEKAKEYVNFIKDDEKPTEVIPVPIEKNKVDHATEDLKPDASTDTDYNSDTDIVDKKVKILKVRLLVERKNEPEGLLETRLKKGK